jgi:hypothetical protein
MSERPRLVCTESILIFTLLDRTRKKKKKILIWIAEVLPDFKILWISWIS